MIVPDLPPDFETWTEEQRAAYKRTLAYQCLELIQARDAFVRAVFAALSRPVQRIIAKTRGIE